MLGPAVAEYQLNSVAQIAALTIAVSTAAGIAGTLYPKSVQHWAGILLSGFLLVILGDVVRIGMLAFGYPCRVHGGGLRCCLPSALQPFSTK